MKLKEAIETLEKLKEFEGKVKMYKDIIDAFEIIPLKYLKENNIEYDIHEILKYNGKYFESFPNNIDFDIVSIHFLGGTWYKVSRKEIHYKHLII
ncbi:hypothetical protein [Polaribacter ponticola]|uniref:Uncharacterized protein n=1 Tax=Polaribacter ponticola TaxID=2978475 RepID=A0ABT5S6V5_9FLAO|nr:hypothetical protein [Polaribacter sp. MSW5]MDD7913822.1 hypothetical protein [Polaribacter sp. MSW5]